MTSTKDQEDGLAFLDAFINDPSANGKQATLCGYAGVGKTWLIGHWLTTLLADEQCKENVCIAAPTHKALDVLRQKCGHLPVTFKTLHSLLGVMVRKTEEGDTEQDTYEPDLSFTLVVVDEGSMVNQEFADILAEKIAFKKIGRVLYVGDPAQLPPVKEDMSPVFKIERSFTMREVVRYDGAIIKVATFLRERIAEQNSFILSDITQFITAEDRSLSIITRAAIYNWASTARKANLDCRILAWTNAQVLTHNDRMHKLCFPDAPFFGVDERVLLGDSHTLRAPKRGERMSDQDSLYNGEVLTVTKCEQVTTDEDEAELYQTLAERGVVIYRVQATRETGQIVDVKVALSESRVVFVHKQLNEEIYQARRNGDYNSAAFKHLLAVRRFINKLCPLRHSYACTVHKSQGSTYDISMVDFGDVYRSDDRARLMYVAATRPSKFLVLVR